MKSKIPILLLALLVLVSCTQKPLIVKIPLTLEDRVELEKYDKIYFGGFDISTTLTDPDPKKELTQFFTDDFQQAVRKKTEFFKIEEGPVSRLDAIKELLKTQKKVLFITGKLSIEIKNRSIVKDEKKKKKKAFVKIQIWEMTWKVVMIDSETLKPVKEMTLDSKLKDADPEKSQFNFKSLFNDLTERFIKNISKRYRFQNRYLLKNRK